MQFKYDLNQITLGDYGLGMESLMIQFLGQKCGKFNGKSILFDHFDLILVFKYN